MTASLVILTGASASGKTTLAQYFLKHPECEVFFFDSIGVPPVEKMEADYGSAEAWQRAIIFQWIGRIRPVLSAEKPALFEGQMRIAFLKEALAAHEITSAHSRAKRLETELKKTVSFVSFVSIFSSSYGILYVRFGERRGLKRDYKMGCFLTNEPSKLLKTGNINRF